MDTESEMMKNKMDSVMVSGLLKNISDKVTTKLDPESEDDLVQIISKKMEEGGGVEEQGVSFDDWPSGEHLIKSQTDGRVKGGKMRRLPSSIGKADDVTDELDVEEDFDSLLAASSSEGTSLTGQEEEENVDDVFDSLLKESIADTEAEGEDTPRKRSVDDDFNLLLEDNDIKTEELEDKVEVSKPLTNGSEEDINKERNIRKEDTVEGKIIESHDINNVLDASEASDEKVKTGDVTDLKLDSINQSSESHPEQTYKKDPFDELFEELDAQTVKNVDRGFQKIFATETLEQQMVEMPSQDVKKQCSNSEVIDENAADNASGENTEVENEANEGVKEIVNVEKQVEQKKASSDNASKPDQNCTSPQDTTEKKVIEIEELIDESRLRELAAELARELVQAERDKHKEEVIGLAREVVGEREVFTDRIDRLEGEVKSLNMEVMKREEEVESLKERLEVQAGHLAQAREEARVMGGLAREEPGEAGRKVVELERELEDMKEVNSQLKAYVGEVLVNIMVKNPQILEKKA